MAETHQTICIGDQEHANEYGDSIPCRDLIAQRLDARYTRRLGSDDRRSSLILVFGGLHYSAAFTGITIFLRHAARQWIESTLWGAVDGWCRVGGRISTLYD